MNLQLLSIVYAALFVTGLTVGIPLLLIDKARHGVTAILLGLISLADALAWDLAKSVSISSQTLRLLDLVGVLCGAVAVIAPAAASANPVRSYRCLLAGCTGYIGACLAFWLCFEQLDPDAYGKVLQLWSKNSEDVKKFIAAFTVALAALATFVVMLWRSRIEPNGRSSWIALNIALAAYCVLYLFFGAAASLA